MNLNHDMDNCGFSLELQNKVMNELIELSKKNWDTNKLIPSIQAIFSDVFHFVESQYYFENSAFSDINKSAQSSEIFLNIIRNLAENGILDWAMENSSLQLLPNLDINTNEIFQKVLVYPIKSKQSNVFFIATLAPDSFLHNEKCLSKITLVLEYALSIILNSILSEINPDSSLTKSKTDIQLLKLLFVNCRSNIIYFLIEAIKSTNKSIYAQIQFIQHNLEFLEKRIELTIDYINKVNLFTNYINKLQNINVEFKKVNLKEIIENILDILKNISAYEDIEVNFIFNDDKYFVTADPIYLEVALFSILINSIESIESNGKIDILLQKSESQRISLSIIDNGTGINEIDQTQLFKPMFTTKDKTKHSGMSLFFVKQLLNLINAKCSVTSDPSKGTNFKINFGSIVL